PSTQHPGRAPLALREIQRAVAHRDLDLRARPELALEDALCEGVLELLLNRSLERTGAINGIEARFAEQIASRIVERELDVALREALTQVAQLDVHDRA